MEKQKQGSKHDCMESIVFSSYAECDLFYEKIMKVFFHINSWDSLFGKGTNFQLTDKSGKDKSGAVCMEDLVKIKIPGPGNNLGEGFDWIEIKEIIFKQNKISHVTTIMVSPCHSPTSGDKVAHFYGKEATNYFIITKYAEHITAEVHGRNEVPNYKDLPLRDQARNLLISSGGMLAFGKIHWNVWAENILNKEILEKCIQHIK